MSRYRSPYAMTAVTVLAATVAACEIPYGVWRRAPLTQLPPADCVRAALLSTPGVVAVRFQARDTITGDKGYFFDYWGKNREVAGLLDLRSYKHKGQTHFAFEQSVWAMNRKPPQDVVDRTRPVMRSVESNVERRCGLDGLVSAVEERCSRGVKCSHLPGPLPQ
jgi:hypothetical protein